ncbi:MAG: hypothetical protein NTV98_06055 [Candidatus Roizmanbacteria bacterium]|nr:hypothetical protein [Candidatus Roizmanbacteria bacterium]
MTYGFQMFNADGVKTFDNNDRIIKLVDTLAFYSTASFNANIYDELEPAAYSGLTIATDTSYDLPNLISLGGPIYVAKPLLYQRYSLDISAYNNPDQDIIGIVKDDSNYVYSYTITADSAGTNTCWIPDRPSSFCVTSTDGNTLYLYLGGSLVIPYQLTPATNTTLPSDSLAADIYQTWSSGTHSRYINAPSVTINLYEY